METERVYSRNTWHYKRYAALYRKRDKPIPEHAHICTYYWMAMLGPMLYTLGSFLFRSCIQFVNFFAVAWGVGYFNRTGDVFILFEGFQIGKHKVRPSAFMMWVPPTMFMVGHGTEILLVGTVLGTFGSILAAMGVLAAVLFAAFALIEIIDDSRTWDFAQLTRSYISTKWNGVCPTITFSDTE